MGISPRRLRRSEMIVSIKNNGSFETTKPIVNPYPKRMYINIRGALPESVGNEISLEDIAIDGKSIEGYKAILYIQKSGENTIMCIGGD